MANERTAIERACWDQIAAYPLGWSAALLPWLAAADRWRESRRDRGRVSSETTEGSEGQRLHPGKIKPVGERR